MFSKPGYAALAVVTETSLKVRKGGKTYLESTRKYPQNCEITNCESRDCPPCNREVKNKKMIVLSVSMLVRG